MARGSAMSEGYWDNSTNAGQTRDVYETERPARSRLLGPDGIPLAQPPVRIGFDLRRIGNGGRSCRREGKE